MSPITTHVLDTALGQPAKNIPVTLEYLQKDTWKKIAAGTTNNDGRITDLLATNYKIQKGIYCIHFQLQQYFAKQKRKSFYPYASIFFTIENPKEHYHVPLLLSGYGFSTYRGS